MVWNCFLLFHFFSAPCSLLSVAFLQPPCGPHFPAPSQAIPFAVPLCAMSSALSLHTGTVIQSAPHLLLHNTPRFFSCAHLRIKQMQHTQTEYSSSHSHKPVKAYRPRSYLCLNLNPLWGSSLLKGNKAKGYIIIFGVNPTGLGGWLLVPLSELSLPARTDIPQTSLSFLSLVWFPPPVVWLVTQRTGFNYGAWKPGLHCSASTGQNVSLPS